MSRLPPVRLAIPLALALAASALSCGREVTAPRADARLAAFSIAPVFPEILTQTSGAGSSVPFTRVRIVLRHADGTIALDQLVDFPPGADNVPVTLTVPLLAGTTSDGEPLTLSLAYVNAAGDTVFRGGPVRLTVKPTEAGKPPQPAVDVPIQYTGPGATARRVRISPRAISVNTGQAFAFTAQALDESGVAVPGTPIIWGTVDPARALMSASGAGQAQNLRGTARVFATLLTGPADTVSVNIQPVASALAIASGNSQTGTVGTALTAPLVVKVTANDGLGVAGVTVAFAVSSGGGAVTATAVTGDDGTASAAWTLGTTVGAQTVTATAAGVARAVTFTATGTVPVLVFGALPSNVQVGQPFGVTVSILEPNGSVSTAFTGAVSIGLSGNPAGDALTGTLTMNAMAGVASFSGLKLSKIANGVSLAASSSGLVSVTSAAFNVGAGTATKLVFSSQPANAVTGASIGSITVQALDASDNPAPTFVGTVSIGFAANPGSATLGGTVSAAAVSGVATFSGVTVSRAANGYALTASADRLASATSAAFNITSTAAQFFGLVSGNTQTATAGSVLAPIVMYVRDASGNAKAGIDVLFSVATGGGSVTPATATTDAQGYATATWTLGSTIGAQTLTAQSGGLTGSPFTVSATATAAPTRWVITTQPAASTTAGVAIGTVVATLKDPANATITSYNGSTTIGFFANPGSATLSGTTTTIAASGVATFGGLSLNKAASAYALQVTGGSATVANTNTFNIVAAAAANLALQSGNLQNATPGTTLASPIVALATDAFGNPVSGKTVTFAIATGGGSVGTASATTNASGLAQSTWTLGGGAGAQTVTVTAAGLTGSPLTVTANSGGAVATTTVAPHTTTLTALGATFSPTATAKDIATNVVAGSFTWLSRSTAIATVNASTGLVTAVANGSTYVVATEAGGTKDSIQIVVAQALASITVTPNPRDIYLGASYGFAASAVDGLGRPLVAQPSFTWSTQSGAIATINASTGVATGTGLGSTLVQATSGAVTGTATLNVLTPITRIVVSRDSAGFSTTAADTFTLSALGKRRSYKATARDTLDNVLTGINFTWASSNSSVAGIDSINLTTVRATAAANGNTRVTATAQGVSGSALLNVQQVLSSIDLSPTTATIAVTGTTALIARGKDANSFFISGAGPFTFASSSPANATVDASTGVVSGIANGSAVITATSGAITSNSSTITIGGTVPPIISFGRDTLTIGRSASNVAIPIYLSKPNGSNVTVTIAVKDTNAFWSTANVVVPAGQTTVSALLSGRNAGTTQVYATDGSATGFAGDTAVLAVQATVRLTAGSYSVNVTDQFTTQVLLSDPSPAGGTFVTFSYGTAGKANVSPDPSFIPAGQLSANIVVSGVAAGSTTITPAATGVNGTASSVTVNAANLTQAYTSYRLGVGQYESNPYVYSPGNMSNPLSVTMNSADTSKVSTTPPVVTIPAGYNYSYYQLNGKALTTGGAINVTPSAAGWTATNTMAVTVTTPKVGVSGGGSYNTTSPQFALTVYAQDSASGSHYRQNALVVTLTSTNPGVIQVVTPTVTIPAGQYYTSAAQAIPGGAGGTARIIVTASGHTPDSTSLYTVTGPALTLSMGSFIQLGAGQYEQNYYVYTPNNITGSPLNVALNVADSTIAAMPPTVSIPVGYNYVYFTIRGKVVGQTTFNATAAGFTTSGTTTVRVSSPRVTLSGGGTMNNFAPAQGFTAYSADSSRTGHYRTAPLIITYTSTNPAVFTVTGSDTIQPGAYYTSHSAVTPTGVGTAQLVASAPGHLPDTLTYTVVTPKLNFSFNTATLGRRQYETGYYLYTPNNRTSNLTVTVTQARPTVDSLTTNSIVIPNGTNYLYFTIAGKTTGADTLIASAPGYLPDTAWVVVTTPKFTGGTLPSTATTTTPPTTVTVYATDSVGTGHYVLDTIVVKATSSNVAVIQPTAPGFKILPGTYYSQPQVAFTGPGSASMTYADSLGAGYGPVTSNSVTVTGPSLSLSNGSPILGMRQNGGVNSSYVYTGNNVTGSPLVVTLVSSDPTVVSVPATVTIPVGINYVYFNVTALDVIGTIQVQATAPGYGGTTMNVQVTQPKFTMSTTASLNTTSPRQAITVYATDANGTAHYANENVAVTLTSSSTAVGTIDSTVVTIVAGQYYNNNAKFIPGAVGTTQLQAADARVAAYKYSAATQNVAVNTPTLTNSWNNIVLGVGQYNDAVTYTPDYQTANVTVNLSHFSGATTSPSLATVLNGTYYTGNIRIVGASAGIDTLYATAAGHNPTKGQVTVNQGHSDPIASWPTSLSLTGTDSVFVTLSARDAANGGSHPVLAATTFNITGNSRVVFYTTPGTPITSVTIPADGSYVQFWVKGISTGTDSAILFTNAAYATQSLSLTVNP